MKNVIATIAIAFATSTADNETVCLDTAEVENEATAFETEIAEMRDEFERVRTMANRLRKEIKYTKEGYKTFKYFPDSGFKKVEVEGFVQIHEIEMEAIEMLNKAERIRTKIERLEEKAVRFRELVETYRSKCEDPLTRQQQ